MAAAAYLILFNRSQAEAVVVEALAHAWRNPEEAGAAPEPRAWLLGLATTRALDAQRRSRVVDAVVPGAQFASSRAGRAGRDLPEMLRVIAELSPRHRAVVALRYLGGLDPTEAAGALGMSQEAFDADMRAALRRLRSFLPEDARDARPEPVLPWSGSVIDAANRRLEGRLTTALAGLADLLPFGVEAGHVRSLIAGPQAGGRKLPWRPMVLALLAVALAVAAAISIVGGRSDERGASRTARDGPARSAAAIATPLGVAPRTPPIDLASCDITPPDAGLAFAGWATAASLDLPNAGVAAGQPVYALVTSGLAEMVGGRSSAGILPPPIGRLACLFNEATGARQLVAVPGGWRAPAIIDGCPASPRDSFAGYPEVGGPHAWLVLPPDGSGWRTGDIGSQILFRLTRDVAPDQTITGWAAPLDGGARLEGIVDPLPHGPGVARPSADSSADASPPGSQANYGVLHLQFTTAGCWVINIEIEDEVVGSAVVAIGDAPRHPG